MTKLQSSRQYGIGTKTEIQSNGTKQKEINPCTFGEGNGNPLQNSCLENPMDGGTWQAAVHGVPKNRTPLSNFTFTFHFPALEKEIATHSSVLAWIIQGRGSLLGCCLWGCTESDTTEVTEQQQHVKDQFPKQLKGFQKAI